MAGGVVSSPLINQHGPVKDRFRRYRRLTWLMVRASGRPIRDMSATSPRLGAEPKRCRVRRPTWLHSVQRMLQKGVIGGINEGQTIEPSATHRNASSAILLGAGFLENE